ncbi:cyclic pyranopterin monophosphate synthase MoaC [candidate division WOR-3 bacterium]|nr:cyclic pyranopterin monophosphate synthase MoaC [candidate division WOR-3 bacterium]
MNDKIFSHTDDLGKASMVDVSEKKAVKRYAKAEGRIELSENTITLIKQNSVIKGDVLAVANIAGIQGAKKTQVLIPLSHVIPLESVKLSFELEEKAVIITAEVKTESKTGVEMEALTAVAVAALTVYDMCKAVDKKMKITGIKLVEKRKDDR